MLTAVCDMASIQLTPDGRGVPRGILESQLLLLPFHNIPGPSIHLYVEGGNVLSNLFP